MNRQSVNDVAAVNETTGNVAPPAASSRRDRATLECQREC